MLVVRDAVKNALSAPYFPNFHRVLRVIKLESGKAINWLRHTVLFHNIYQK